MIKLLFENLSERLYNENDLSDITWAMCYTSSAFKEAFLKFFFEDMEISEDIEINREVSKDDDRVDFLINNKGETFLIENKINDKISHFGKYDKTYKVTPERFGYIANYPISQEKPYQIRTWEDFYKKLKTTKCDDDIEQSLIEGYREYLKKVCNIIDFEKPMNIEGIYSLYELIEILIKLCKRQEENFSLSVFTKNRFYDNSHADHSVTGINFDLNYRRGSHIKESWGWIGIYFSQEKPIICIGFWDIDGWGKPVCSIIKKAGAIKKGKLHSESYEEEGAYWLDFVDREKTFNTLSLEEQTDMLKSFMDEVLNDIRDYALKLKQEKS